jgi:carboxymethylenebutenolidase
MGQMIELTASDGHKLDAYRADPAADARGAIVVVQEIFGVNAHIKEVCDGFAADGYVAIAPAMFDRAEKGVDLGYGEEDRQKGMETRGKIEWDDNVKDVIAAKDAVADAGKVGIVGYCFGGTVAWLGACEGGFDAAVGYYGGFIHNFLDKNATCPVMLHYGSEDQGIPMENVDMTRNAKPDVEVHVYDGAGHGFICDHRVSYHPDATKAAGERTLAFFGQHL